MRMRLCNARIFVLLACAACCGCGQAGGTSQPSLIPVKGTVSYKGRPLTQGVVTFEPDGYGRAADGKLSADGTFSLTTPGMGDGVVAGEHRVSVSGFDKALARDRVLKKYESANTSRLTASVDAEHTEFRFELK